VPKSKESLRNDGHKSGKSGTQRSDAAPPESFRDSAARNSLPPVRLPFCMVFSETLGEAIFFVEDELTKAALIEAGADEWSIYTPR